jgi:phage replication-related protein YjqB (UPF0714/DUF867 family)
VDVAELLNLPGVEEACVIRSAVGFMALHGGSQDRGTDLIARRAAERAGASYYGIIQPPGLRVHITSRLHRPEHSTVLHRFLQHIEVAISIHGFGRDGFSLWVDPDRGLVIDPYGPPIRGRQTGPLTGIIVGGRNELLVNKARELFHERFEGFDVADPSLRLGYHPENPVNLPSSKGVQIELPPGLRGIGPYGEQLVPSDTEEVAELVTALVELAEFASVTKGTPARRH